VTEVSAEEFSSMRELVFEKVGDINYTYSYLCVYLRGDKEPFMEIGVTDDKELELTIYPRVLADEA
jgi:hypothetical protein